MPVVEHQQLLLAGDVLKERGHWLGDHLRENPVVAARMANVAGDYRGMNSNLEGELLDCVRCPLKGRSAVPPFSLWNQSLSSLGVRFTLALILSTSLKIIDKARCSVLEVKR